METHPVRDPLKEEEGIAENEIVDALRQLRRGLIQVVKSLGDLVQILQRNDGKDG